nr:hypothetical protein [Bacteroidota bacterium]
MKKTILLLAVCLIVVCNVSSQNKFQHQNPHFNPGHDYTGYSHIQNESPGPFHIAQSDQILSPVEEYGDPPDWSWASQFGGSGADVARDLVSSEDGNVYICGSFSGEIVVDGETFNCIGKKDSYVAKFSNTGTFLWLKHIPAAEDEYIEAFGINLDALSNVHVTGYFTGNATVGTHNLLGIGDRNLFYVKLNPDSDILFANDHEGSAYSEVGQVIDTDGAGNAYILGSWEGNLSYRDKSFLLKYDQFGNESFVEYYMQNFNDIEVVGTSIYFAGRVLEPESIGEFVIAIDFVDDVFLLKSDLDLNYQWIKLATQTSTFYSPSVCYGLFVNQMEELFITGNMRSNLTFDNIGLEGYGGFVFKFNAGGDALWGTSMNQQGYDVYYPDDIDGFAGQVQVLIDEYVLSLNAVSGDIINNAKAPSGAVELDVDVSGNINMCGQLNQLIFASQYNTALSQNWMVNFEGNSSSVRV